MPGSKYLWLRWTEDGKRHAVSLKTEDEAEAITKARAILAEGIIHRMTPRTPIDTLVAEYLAGAQERPKKPMRPNTAKNVGNLLRRFTRESGVEVAGQINHQKIRDWLQRLKLEGRSKDTLHSYATDLKTFFRWLVKRKHLAPDVLESFEIPDRGAHGRKNWVRREIVADVIARATTEDLRFILYAGFHAGLRRNEIANARAGWFDLEAGLVHIQNDAASGFVLKDRDNRTVPLTDEFSGFLKVFLKGRSPREYAIRPSKKEAGVWKYRYDFNKLVRAHFGRCGVECSIHDMRRSFAGNLVSAGESVYIVAKWLGDGVQVVERSYGHLAPSAGNINRIVSKPAGHS